MTSHALKLASYIEALRPIIYLRHADFSVADDLIRQVAESRPVLEFSAALGSVNFQTKAKEVECTLDVFLGWAADQRDALVVLKDGHRHLDEPKVIAQLKRIADKTLYSPNSHITVLIVSSKLEFPDELEHLITVFDIPLPVEADIHRILTDFAQGQRITIEPEVQSELALSFKGLSEFNIIQILNLAYQQRGQIGREDRAIILAEKEQVIQKTGRLEIVPPSKDLKIGGQKELQAWLQRKAEIFKQLDKAIKAGVDVPTGILLVGMPGCGKSMAAKKTAQAFDVPLLRLDVGRLFGKYVGESEANMRRALETAQAVSPCVLWIDEIEKAFGSVGGEGDGGVATRLFGHFLTWMQEKKDSSVFVVATANSIENLPPEFLRKGRFDEIFMVDFPNGEERLSILQIHLDGRMQRSQDVDLIPLIEPTHGFSGADLEALVKEAVEAAFLEQRPKVTEEDLRRALAGIKGFSEVMKEQVEKLRADLAKFSLKPASRSSGDPKAARPA